MSARKPRAFSLLETVLVVAIMAILAAIAVPRISSAGKNSSESALRSNLATVRKAIDYYYFEDGNVFPAASGDGVNAVGTRKAFRRQLLNFTNEDGIVSAVKSPPFPYGPYIRGTFPALTVGVKTGLNGVLVLTQTAPLATDVGAEVGWIYNTVTGEIIANANKPGSDGKPYSSW